MSKLEKNIIITGISAGAVAVAVSAFSYIVSGKLMKLALNRKEPEKYDKNRHKVSGSKGVSEAKLLAIAKGEELAAKGLEEVEIESFDGTRLVGHFYPCENASRFIVAMHGWRSSWHKDFGAISEFWHKNGCSVLFAEQRGQNKSGGDHMSFGILERRDCLEWVRWAENNGGSGLPVYLVGTSMGAATVMMASALEMPESVRGIIADCGFTSPHEIWETVVENRFHIPYGLCKTRAEQICIKRINESAKAYSCPEALKKCKVPVLFIHGSDDKFVPIEMTYENYKACASQKRLLVVPGAGHGMSYLTDPERYEETVRLFWDECEG